MNTKGKLKRLIAVAIAGIMVLSLFAGCSKEETTSGTGGDGELPEVELVYYTLGTWPLPDQDAVFAEFNKMLKEKINATVDFRVFDTGSYDQKMQTVIGSGGYYDFCYTSNWSNNFISNVSKGAFLPLDDLLTEYAPNLYASMPEEIWDSVRIDGKIMAAINQQVYASCPAVYLRKHVLEESGYDWQTQYKKGDLRSLEPLIKYIHDNYEKSFFWADYVSTPLIGYEYLGGALPAALDLQGDGKTIVNPFKEDRFKDTVKILQDYNSKGYTASEIRSAYASDPIPFGQMGTSEDGYLAITGTYMPGYDAIMSQGYTEEDKEWQTGWPSIDPFVSTNNLHATLLGVNVASENPERTMMLIELINLPPQEGEKYNELFNTFCFGIEGVNWQYTEDGRRHWLKPTSDYMPNLDWGFGCQFNAVPEDTMDADVYEQQREYNANAATSPALGFSFNPEPVKTEIANCTGVLTEYKRRLELGTITDAEYNEMVNRFDQAGADAIVKEMQSQLDEYLASK